MATVFKRTYRQDLTKPLQIHYDPSVVFSKDNLANEIQIDLYNGTEAASISGTVSGTVIRANGSTVPIETGTISGNAVTVALAEACMEIPGPLQVYVKLSSGDVKTTIFAGVFTAIRTETETIIDPGTIIPSVTDLINQIQAAIDSIPADYSTLLASVAGTYSTSKTYAVGDYAWYDGRLKKCIVPITTAETWTAAHWADAVITDDVASLKSAMVNKDGINEVKIKNIEGVQIGNLFAALGVLDKENKFAYANSSGVSLSYSDSTVQNCYRVPIKKNTHYVITYARWLVLLDENLKSTAIGSQYVTEFDSGNAVWAEISFNVTTYPPSTYVMSEGTQLISEPYIYPDWISKESELEKKVDKEGYNQVLRKNIEGVQIGNLFSVLAETDQEGKYAYCNSVLSGLQYMEADSFNCYFLKVDKNTDYVCTTCRFLVKLDKNKSPIATSEESITSFNSGNAEYVSLSFNVNTYAEDSIIVSKGTSLIPKEYVYPDWLSPYSTAYKYKSFHKEGNLSDGESLVLDESVSLKKGEMLSFACDITSFTGLVIGWTTSTPNTQKNPYIEINSTQIIVHGQNSNGSSAVTLTHGLTIANNLQFKVVVHHNSFIVELITNGTRYTGTANLFKSDQGKGFALCSGSTLTNCKLSWESIDMNKKVWMFGDSYFGMTNPARWVYWLQESGFAVDALIDAYGGRASDNAIISLNNLIKNGTPDFIVWCMGMNDGTDANSQPSSAWVIGRDTVIGLCEAYNIIPVFATIPSVPNIDHTYKNAWIRSSGYRYVDFDKAVGANVSNEWYTGMLSTDNVHPTEKGALALYGRFMADFPEIVIN